MPICAVRLLPFTVYDDDRRYVELKNFDIVDNLSIKQPDIHYIFYLKFLEFSNSKRRHNDCSWFETKTNADWRTNRYTTFRFIVQQYGKKTVLVSGGGPKKKSKKGKLFNPWWRVRYELPSTCEYCGTGAHFSDQFGNSMMLCNIEHEILSSIVNATRRKLNWIGYLSILFSTSRLPCDAFDLNRKAAWNNKEMRVFVWWGQQKISFNRISILFYFIIIFFLFELESEREIEIERKKKESHTGKWFHFYEEIWVRIKLQLHKIWPDIPLTFRSLECETLNHRRLNIPSHKTDDSWKIMSNERKKRQKRRNTQTNEPLKKKRRSLYKKKKHLDVCCMQNAKEQQQKGNGEQKKIR